MRTNERTATWHSWSGHTTEVLHVGEESGGWTADGRITDLVSRRHDVHYVVRFDATWQVSQFLLFRDLDEPDLWLATDGHGRWGEVNGAHRDDLTGCGDIDLTGSPFTRTIAMRRGSVAIGDHADVLVAVIEPETLQVRATRHRIRRVQDRSWIHQRLTDEGEIAAASDVDLDEHGLPLDIDGEFRRAE